MELLYRLPTLWSEFKNWFLEDEDDPPLFSPPITPVTVKFPGILGRNLETLSYPKLHFYATMSRCVLETVRILAHHTRDVQQEFVKYAMEGSALEVATLLFAVPEMFMPSISYLKKQVLERTSLLLVRDVRSAWAYGSDDLSEERMFMEVILVLFELFERSSNKFTAHLRRNMENVEGFQIYDDIRELLEGVGICIDHVDRYVSSLSYRSLSDLISDQQEVSSPNVRKCEGDQMGCVFNKPKVLLYPKGRKLQGELQELTLADPSSALANPLVSQVHRESFSDGATKLLEGKSSLINSAKEVGISRLHLPAMSLSPRLVEQYMHHEAWTNVQWNDSNILPYLKMLPLNLALEALCLHQYVTDWTPGKSIFKLIYILCLPEMVEPLKTVELLSSDTAVVQMVASICLQEGEFVRLATLLMTSWDKLVVPDSDVDSSLIGKHVLKELQIVLDQESKSACSKGISLSQFRRKKGALLFAASMLEIFRIARAPLEKYRLSPEVKDILRSEVPLGVSHLLRSLGFHLRREDVDKICVHLWPGCELLRTLVVTGHHSPNFWLITPVGMISGGDNRKSHWMEGQNALLMSLERTKEPVPDAFHWRLAPSFKALTSFTPRTFHRHRSMELNDLAADLWQAPGNRLHYVARPLCPIKRIAFAAMTTTRWIKFI